MAVFLEISVFRQGVLALPLRREFSLLSMFLKSHIFIWICQRCNLFVKSSAGTSVWYTTFPGIYSANCC